ncbi:integrator complex subunit 6-like [Neovison vison]|uniref:integrator complex subunit 6-like n=1 Tax=Neovison vison TaxID=452646 RepID=UPI001CF04939|nr:integrator complex subunit 6-like [Neogale vison]
MPSEIELGLQQTKNDEGDQFAAELQQQMKHPDKPSSPSSTKRRQSATVTHDVREKKTESHPTPPDGFLPKIAAPEVTNRAGAGIPPNQLDSPTDDFTKDGLIPKPGSNSLGGGNKNCSGSAGDPKGPAMSSPGAVPNTLQISPAVAKKINDDIKYQLMKEVRKFGRKYERIFTLIEEVQGPLAVKKQFVEFTIMEAARF